MGWPSAQGQYKGMLKAHGKWAENGPAARLTRCKSKLVAEPGRWHRTSLVKSGYAPCLRGDSPAAFLLG
jgi:hypothetical protein